MREVLYKIISDVFNVSESMINKDSSPDTIPGWDSLKHINLVLALEQEFEIQFSEEQIINLLNVELIEETLKEHDINF
jgi:acyl carrier protein